MIDLTPFEGTVNRKASFSILYRSDYSLPKEICVTFRGEKIYQDGHINYVNRHYRGVECEDFNVETLLALRAKFESNNNEPFTVK